MKTNFPGSESTPSQVIFSTGRAANNAPKIERSSRGNLFSDSESYPSIHDTILSAETMKVMNEIRALEKSSAIVSEQIQQGKNSLEEQLFDARAQVKILFSRVSMHFDKALRSKIFEQIDLLHDLDDWEDGDKSVEIQSFNTFLRWFYLARPIQLPSFGLSSAGHLIASWVANENRDVLVLEYLADDKIKWFVTKFYDDEVEQTAGTTTIPRINNVLSPYQPEDWFSRC